MWKTESSSLPEWIEDAYEILAPEIEGSEGGFSQAEAQNRLLDHDAFPSEPADAEYAIERLLDSGWLYEVDESLCVTDSEREVNDGSC
jgi:hypothetical protein